MPALTKPKDRRCVVVGTRVTAQEAEMLSAKAEQEAMTLSDLVRTRLFPKRTKAEREPAPREPGTVVNVNLI